jgi:hypothetical protein
MRSHGAAAELERRRRLALQSATELLAALARELREIRWDQHLLWSFWHGSDLPLPRKLLS